MCVRECAPLLGFFEIPLMYVLGNELVFAQLRESEFKTRRARLRRHNTAAVWSQSRIEI
jgi:hypothetical protein